MTALCRLFLLAAAIWTAAFAAGGCAAGADGDDTDTAPEPICLQPGDGPYPLAFTEVTEALGLGPSGLNLAGNLVSIGDVNGDHWPDLFLSKGGAVRDDPAAPTGLFRLLLNQGGSSFQDATFTSGLFTAKDGTSGRATTFVIFGDVDNDGDADALSAVYETTDNYTSLLDDTAVFLNDGTGHFSIGPSQSFSPEVVNPISGAAFLDYDHDGILDLYLGHHYLTYGYESMTVSNSLLRGGGTGVFADVTQAAGVETIPFTEEGAPSGNTNKPSWGVTACDLDGDGWDDLLSNSYGRQFNLLFRNAGAAFEDLTMTSGFAADANEDYSDNQFFLCYCQTNPDAEECAGAASPVISCDATSWTPGADDHAWRLGGNSSNAVCGDIDNDGDMDLLEVELAHWHIGQSSDKTELLINDGFPAVPFRRPGNDVTGLTREHAANWNEGDLGGILADFDNDGALDVLVASSDYPDTYSLLWQQQADDTFVEVGEGAGARVQRSHGIALVDYDRDGDYDIVSGTSSARWATTDNPPYPGDVYAHVLRNDTGAAANKIMIHLRGAGVAGGANRDAVGARVTVRAGERTFVREVQGGYGLDGIQQDDLVIIGIGNACTADSVTVRWPNAALAEETFTSVLANYVLVIEEGQPLVYQALAEYAPAAP
jgi:enediyne biosynthesis protein E4